MGESQLPSAQGHGHTQRAAEVPAAVSVYLALAGCVIPPGLATLLGNLPSDSDMVAQEVRMCYSSSSSSPGIRH